MGLLMDGYMKPGQKRQVKASGQALCHPWAGRVALEKALGGITSLLQRHFPRPCL